MHASKLSVAGLPRFFAVTILLKGVAKVRSQLDMIYDAGSTAYYIQFS